MSGESDLVDIECSLVHETDGAYLIDDGDQEVWVPKSKCELSQPDKNKHDLRILTLPEWLAIDKGLV